MANTISKQTLHDGERNLVVKVTISGDSSGDESSTSIVDVSTFDGAPSEVKITKIWASFGGFAATLEWNADTNVDIITIAGDAEFNKDFKEIGGLINNAGTGVNGDILMTTLGLASEDGTIILWMRKR